MTAPLEGIRVLEVASWLAAPSCAALLTDMGAEVIKVEPPGGDSYRNGSWSTCATRIRVASWSSAEYFDPTGTVTHRLHNAAS